MMNQTKTKKAGLVKYLLIAPLSLALILSSNAETLISSAYSTAEVNNLHAEDIAETIIGPMIRSKKGETIFYAVEKMPEFPGGMEAQMKYLSENTKYPPQAIENGIQGRVAVRCVVGPDGKIRDAKIVIGVSEELDKEAIRVVEAMPDWTPGEQGGKKVAVYFTLPINFSLGEDEKKASATKILDKMSTENPPLIVIDGKVQDKDFDMNTVIVDKIEKIDVLKDESARSKYGEKGKNGVIIITMKQNKK